MSGVTLKSGFQSLSNFAKPAACEFHVIAERSRVQGNGTLGWKPGESRIYYQDGTVAGHYDLTKPLDKMTRAELDAKFRDNTSYVVKNEGFLRLWEFALAN